MKAASLRPSLAGFALVAASFCLAPGRADGKITSNSPYSRAQTYNGALRYIRVDQGFEVFEQDRESGYLLFKYQSDGDGSTGSVEVIQIKDQVKVIVQLPRMPRYHEQVLADGLLRKLRDEYGEPPLKEPPKPKDDVIRRRDDDRDEPKDKPPKKDEERSPEGRSITGPPRGTGGT